MKHLIEHGAVGDRFRPWLILLAVMFTHCFSVWNWSHDVSCPTPAWHNNQLTQAVYVMVLAGASRVQHLPPKSAWQVPASEPGHGRWQLLGACFNPHNDLDQYFTTSLFLLLSSVLPLIFGLDPDTLLWGTVLPVGVLLAATFVATRSIVGPSTAAAAAVLLSLLPVSVFVMRTAFPFIGLMIGPLLVVAALFASDRFRRIGWVILAAYLTALLPRWGESAGDALRALFSIACVVAVLGTDILTKRTELMRRRCVGLLVYCVVVVLLIDADWFVYHATRFVIPRLTEGDSLPLVSRCSEIVVAFVGYIVEGARSMLGFPSTVVVLAGVTSLIVSFRGKRRVWQIHITSLAVWFLSSIVLVSIPIERQSYYTIGAVPPLVILTVVGLREVPKIGRHLPWVGVLSLVPVYVTLSSPVLLQQWLSTARSGFAHFQFATSAAVLGAPNVDAYGISSFSFIPSLRSPTDPERFREEATDSATLEWVKTGEGHEAFVTMPSGSLVVAVSGDHSSFDSIGALVQASYPGIVFRELNTGSSAAEAIRESTPDDQWPLVAPIFESQREHTYIATFRSYRDRGGTLQPPRYLGTTTDLVIGDHVAIHEIVTPPTRSSLQWLVSAPAAGPHAEPSVGPPDEPIAPLVARLASDDFDTRNEAAHQLAAFGAEGCAAVVAEHRAGRIYKYLMGEVFEHVGADVARTEIPRYLADADDDVVHYAALAVLERGMIELLPDLRRTIDGMERGRLGWALAHALWEMAPGDDSARRILDAGRGMGEPPEVANFAIIDQQPYRSWLTDEERVHYLVNKKLSMLDHGPECLNIELDRIEETRTPHYWDDDDDDFLVAHRKQVIEHLRPRLEEDGSPLAALLLGHLGDHAAIPHLQHRFLTTVEFYGWETSYPDELSAMQFPKLHAYEQALERLTGQPLEGGLRLTEDQRASLLRRQDATALYVLHRLSPTDARAIVLEQFRTRGRRLGRFHAALIIHGYGMLEPGTAEERILEILGAPDRSEGTGWHYDTAGLAAPMTLELRFDGGSLHETRLVEAERYH